MASSPCDLGQNFADEDNALQLTLSTWKRYSCFIRGTEGSHNASKSLHMKMLVNSFEKRNDSSILAKTADIAF